MSLSAHSSARAVPIHERLPNLLAALGEGLYERQDALRLGPGGAYGGRGAVRLWLPGEGRRW
ncbi:hypothetical protein ACLH0B_01265 [Aeromonas salmonicida]|uniref:hypothetical protein n=1 Tax=Aeromonas salmonicida TaxID=645 RepID=UPI003D03F693